MNIKTLFLTFSILLSVLFTSSSMAIKPIYSGGSKKAAIRGYDPVAYFTENEAVLGSEEFTLEYKEATWWFSSLENKQTFEENPESYVPQYGGYCAYAVARKTSASSKPEYFTIHDGKLYLNYSKGVYKKWNKEKDKYISDANNNWSSVLAK